LLPGDLPDQGGDAKPKRRPAASKATEEQFDRFWAVYPRDKGKAEAKKRFLALTPEDAEKAIAAAAAYASECRSKGTEPQYIKWAEGWLSKRRFEDYKPIKGASPDADIEAEVQRRAAAEIGRLMIGSIGRTKALEELRKQVLRERGGANG
jgi:hypothetical protein